MVGEAASLPRGGSASRWLFATAPLAPVAAGGLLLAAGAAAIRTPWAAQTLALTHLATLGFLVIGLAGALYGALPEAECITRGGVPLWRVVHGGLCLGVAGLASGFLTAARPLLFASLGVLFVAMLLLFLSIVPPLARLRAASAPALRTAVGSLALTAFFGLWMGHAHVGVTLPGDRALWLQVHLSLGLLGWVGGFAGATAPGPRVGGAESLIRIGVALTALTWAVEIFAGLDGRGVDASTAAGLAALPAAAAVWGLRSWAALRAPRASVWVRASAVMAWIAGAAAVSALVSHAPRAQLLFGWLAIWGWAGLFVHGLIRDELEREEAAAPQRARAAVGLHGAALVCGVGAIALVSDALARATGLLLVGTGVATGRDLLRRCRERGGAAHPDEAR